MGSAQPIGTVSAQARLQHSSLLGFGRLGMQRSPLMETLQIRPRASFATHQRSPLSSLHFTSVPDLRASSGNGHDEFGVRRSLRAGIPRVTDSRRWLPHPLSGPHACGGLQERIGLPRRAQRGRWRPVAAGLLCSGGRRRLGSL